MVTGVALEAVGRLVASAPASSCGPSHLRREDAASGRGRLDPAWSHRDTGADEVSNRDTHRSFKALDGLGVKLYDDPSHMSGVQP
jgi:hypothetical protein